MTQFLPLLFTLACPAAMVSMMILPGLARRFRRRTPSAA